MTITVKSDQTIFDIALIAYQDASRVYDLIAENPQIENINYNLTGLTLNYTPATVTEKEVIKTITSSKNNVTISSRQSLFDIALQYYGGAENVFDVITQNGLDSILSDPTGIALNYTINNTYAPLYYRTKGLTVATKPIPNTESVIENFRITTYGDYRITTSGDFRIHG